ncbi:MAG: formylmethanofuran dehydrogenase subunit A [Gemmatimonadetes bacterium]|nr:formylmethanofuran dehydrogenase subunit A [Gemmatimonadota bacterium]
MLLKLTGGRVYDPAHGVDGQVRDVYVRDGRIVAAPAPGTTIDREIDLRGRVVMAGAIDMHTHIGGGKLNIARAMLPEDHRGEAVQRSALLRASCGHAAPGTFATGYRYAEMGYTAAFEPALLPMNARQAHLEMGDVPMVDKGGYAMLGSDDFLLRLMAAGTEQAVINDYVAWTLHAARCIGIKVVNPAGISAFKFNARRMDLEDRHPYYGVSPRDVLRTLARAVHELGVPFPLHVHSNLLGVPGNFPTTLGTVEASEGHPIHLTHIQFHSYGTEGDRKFSSAAAQIAAKINATPNASCDVGQILFGQTVTASGDNMSQHRNAAVASPKKSVTMDIECDAGCGVLPFRYKDKNFVNALQWAIGLELFLLVTDPWKIFLTTDHPNGAPFTTYPHLIRLLMDRTFRNECLGTINPDARTLSTLGSLEREYTLYEIAILTRAGPARLLGITDMGHLAPGARADITVYRDDANREAMFTTPEYVFKDGEEIVRDGRIVKVVQGRYHTVEPEYDPAIDRRLAEYFEKYLTIRSRHMWISRDELSGLGHDAEVVVHPTRRAR